MPDEHGLLSKADNDAIQRWWDLRWQDPVICPVCKGTDWSLTSHLVIIQRFATDANASNAPTCPHVVITCKFCAHSMFFNAVQIGIATTDVSTVWQATAGAAASDLSGQRGVFASLADLIQKQD